MLFNPLRTAAPAAIAILASLATPSFAAERLIARDGTYARWSVFEDDGFCWIATAVEMHPGSLILTVDAKGLSALTVSNSKTKKLIDGSGHVLRIGTQVFPLTAKKGWAHLTKKQDDARLLKAIMSADTVRAELLVQQGKSKPQKIKVGFKTRAAQTAMARAREACS